VWLDGRKVYEGDAPEDWVDLSGECEAGAGQAGRTLTATAGGLEATAGSTQAGPVGRDLKRPHRCATTAPPQQGGSQRPPRCATTALSP
jgi:hypothetical protein